MKHLLYLSLFSAFACGKKPGSYEIQSAAETSASDDLAKKAEEQWNGRADKAQLEAALATYETLFAQDPKNREYAGRLVRGWYFYGDAYESDIEAKKSAWDKAITFGEKCLSINEEYAAIYSKEEKREDAAQALTKEDVPCTYWTASALGKWAKASGIAVTLKYIGGAKAFIAKVEELEPTYFHGAVHRYWGAYYAGLPSFAGQDLDRSKTEFEKAISISTDYLGTRILLADYWATKNQDQVAIFDEQVQYVMASDVNALDPELIPENLAEIAKAKKLWELRSEKFLDAPDPAALQNQPPVAPPSGENSAEKPAEEATVEKATECEECKKAEGECEKCKGKSAGADETATPGDSAAEPAEKTE